MAGSGRAGKRRDVEVPHVHPQVEGEARLEVEVRVQRARRRTTEYDAMNILHLIGRDRPLFDADIARCEAELSERVAASRSRAIEII